MNQELVVGTKICEASQHCVRGQSSFDWYEMPQDSGICDTPGLAIFLYLPHY